MHLTNFSSASREFRSEFIDLVLEIGAEMFGVGEFGR